MTSATKTLTSLLVLTLLLALGLTLAPTFASADVLADVQSLFEQQKEEDDPFLLIHAYYVKAGKQAQDSGNLTSALEFFRIASTIDRRDRDSMKSARDLLRDLTTQAAALYDEGVTLQEKGDADTARKKFLEALRLNPNNTKPLAYLKDKMLVQPEESYVIQEGDTLRRISEKIYGNPGGELLLTRINKLSIADRLKPGESLLVPVVPPALAKRLALVEFEPEPMDMAKPDKQEVAMAHMKDQPSLPMAQKQDISQSEATGVEALLAMANIQFGNGLYETAVSMTDEILSTQPGNTKAADIRNESYYRMAKGLWDKGSASQSMRMLRRLPSDYKDSATLRSTVQAKLNEDSEPLYLAGVRYFLNEDLENAVEQWELALEMNPFHPKARTDLEKARKLLEAVKGL